MKRSTAGKSTLTVKDIRRVVKALRANDVPPCFVATQAEADELNAYDREIGLEGNWKVGDEYYIMKKRKPKNKPKC